MANTDLNTAYSRLGGLLSGRLSPQAIPPDAWMQVIPLALGHSLGPMLLWVVRQGQPLPEDEPLWQPLFETARQAALQYALLENARLRLGTALAEADIPAIWLKGIALAHTVYPEPRLRPMGDLDILVPYNQREAGRQVAEGLGFQTLDLDYLGMADAAQVTRYHDQLVGGVGGSITLEVHFNLLSLDTSPLPPEERLAWFWGQTRSLGPPEKGFTILKPEAHLLYLCAHAILRHGEAYLTLLQLLDLHLLATKNALDWQLVVEQALALRWSYAVERALESGVEVFQTAVPEEVFVQLRDRRPADEVLSAAQRLRVRAARWEEWKLICRSLPPARRLRLVWTTLFPPKTFIRQIYNLQPSQPVFPYYFYRGWDRGREIARALGAWAKGRA